jgi:hypothetical protein
MPYELRIDGHAVQTFDTEEQAGDGRDVPLGCEADLIGIFAA